MSDRAEIRRRSKLNTRQALNFKAELVRKRKDHKLSQAIVAERMGVSQSTVAEFERYDSNPTMRTIQRYANAVRARITMSVKDDCVTDYQRAFSELLDGQTARLGAWPDESVDSRPRPAPRHDGGPIPNRWKTLANA